MLSGDGQLHIVPNTALGEGGGTVSLGAHRSLWAFLVLCLPLSIAAKVLTLCPSQVSAQESCHC